MGAGAPTFALTGMPASPAPPEPLLAVSAVWNTPVGGKVNVKLSRAAESGGHFCQSDFFIRMGFQERVIGEILTAGTALTVAPELPSVNPGPDVITYDGTCPTLKAADGEPLQAFELPIIGA